MPGRSKCPDDLFFAEDHFLHVHAERLNGEPAQNAAPSPAGHIHGLLKGRFQADALENHIRAAPARELTNRLDRILAFGGDRDIYAHPLADGPPLGAEFRHDHFFRSRRAGHESRHLAHWATANHNHDVAGLNLALVHKIYAAGQDLHQRTFRIAQVIRQPGAARGRRPDQFG